MTSKILINASDPEECRIAKVTQNRLAEFQIASASRETIHDNIYKGIVSRIEPALQAAFIDFGCERQGFLQKNEIHSDYYQETPSGDHSIKNIVKHKQELLVQVVKDPIMHKGAMLTTYLSLAGRYVVLMPGNKNRGISRKIEDEEERQRLKDIINSINIPEGFGIIVRTAGKGCTKTQLSKDFQYLLKLWRNINKKGIEVDAPSLLHKERNIAVRSIRDYLTPDVTEILIDNDAIYSEIKNFIHIISPKQLKIVKHYRAEKPIFTKFQLEEQIANIYERRVKLKSGGSIVIEQTEALVAIDVNSGRGTHKNNIEETALMTNIEATEEIARQLRLRDLGGLIVLDFIDMRDSKNRVAVEKSLKTHLRGDKAKVSVGKISKFGLMEMSRQRILPSIDFGSHGACPYCRGKGLIPSTETLSLRFLRKLKMRSLKHNTNKLNCKLPIAVADYILNKKRKEILDLETRHDLSICISGESHMLPGESEILSDSVTETNATEG
jgi:ribonuclease E